MQKTVSIGSRRVQRLPETTSAKLASLKLAYQKKHKENINFNEIVSRLIDHAKIRDEIETLANDGILRTNIIALVKCAKLRYIE